MHVAFSILRLGPMGGKERDFIGLVELVVARGHTVTVLLGEPAAHAFDKAAQVRMLPVRAHSNHARQSAFAEAVGRYREEARDIDALVAFDWAPRADYVFVANPPFAERQLGWKRLLPRYRAFLRLERDAFRAGGPFIFFLCTAQAERYGRLYDIAADRYAIMPATFGAGRALPPGYYVTRAAVRGELGLAPETPVLIHIATNGYLKGLDRVIDALPRLPHAALLSIGDSSRAMRARARRAGVEDRVRFLGASDDVPRLLGAADLLVHPARSENTGTVILESILYGVPALVSAECGYAEHVSRSGAGAVLATPFDREAFAAEIAGLLAPARLADAKARAQRYGQTLSAEAGLPRVAAAMLDIIARRQRGGT